MHRTGVAGGNVAELPGHSVQDPVDHRRQLLGRRVKREQPVQTGGDFGADRGGRLYSTSLSTMILEVYYRHMPLYGKQAAEDDFPLGP